MLVRRERPGVSAAKCVCFIAFSTADDTDSIFEIAVLHCFHETLQRLSGILLLLRNECLVRAHATGLWELGVVANSARSHACMPRLERLQGASVTIYLCRVNNGCVCLLL